MGRGQSPHCGLEVLLPASRVCRELTAFSNPAEVRSRYIDVLTPVASELNLTLDAFGLLGAGSRERLDASAGRITLSDIFDEPLAPAPVTPTFGSPAWELLSGTILSTLGSALRSDKVHKLAYVGPEMTLGNTGESLVSCCLFV